MQTINCKYLPATNTKGVRIKATCEGGSVTISRDYGVDIEQDYKAAAYKLKMRLGWTEKMIGGHTKDGMIFVFYNELYIVE